MKRLALLASLFVLGFSASAQPLKVGVLQELAAFAPGLSKVFQESNIAVELIPMATARIIADVNSGSLGGAFLISEAGLTALPEAVKVPVVLYQNYYIAVTARKDLRIRSTSDLAGLHVGYVRANKSFESILSKVPQAVAEGVTDTPQLYKMIGSNRVDVILSTPEAFSIFSGLSQQTLFPQDPPLESYPLYFVLSKSAAGSLTAVTNALNRVVKNGSWDRIVADTFAAMRAHVQAQSQSQGSR